MTEQSNRLATKHREILRAIYEEFRAEQVKAEAAFTTAKLPWRRAAARDARTHWRLATSDAMSRYLSSLSPTEAMIELDRIRHNGTD